MTTKRSSYKQATRKGKKIKCFFVMMYKDYRLFSMFEVCAYLNFFAPFSDCFSLFLLPFLVVCKILCMSMSMYFLVFDVLLLKCRYLVWLSLFSILHSPFLCALVSLTVLIFYSPFLCGLVSLTVLIFYSPFLCALVSLTVLIFYSPFLCALVSLTVLIFYSPFLCAFG